MEELLPDNTGAGAGSQPVDDDAGDEIAEHQSNAREIVLQGDRRRE